MQQPLSVPIIPPIRSSSKRDRSGQLPLRACSPMACSTTFWAICQESFLGTTPPCHDSRIGARASGFKLSHYRKFALVDCIQICVMLWDMKKKKVDPLAYAAKVRKEAERM